MPRDEAHRDQPALERLESRTAGLLPSFVHAVVVQAGDSLEIAPEEARLLTPAAVPKRRAEFSAGRVAARQALLRAGLAHPPPLLAGARGEPLWPAGWVGSISHALDVAIAVVARENNAVALGIDIEARAGAPAEVASQIATPRELHWVALERPGWPTRLGLLFSAKESIYKALYPSFGLDLDFLDVELTWLGRARQFQAEIITPGVSVPGAGARLRVATDVVAAHVVTAVCCRAR